MIRASDDILESVQEPHTPSPRHPERVPLYGGVSGLDISVPEFVFCEGLVARETYAHVMAPYMMAFHRPEKPGAHHPAPWKAAGGGLGFDITIEVALAQDAHPTGLNRLNTLWWVLVLLRLTTGAALRMPVISDIAFAAVPSHSEEPMLWTLEMPPNQLRIMRNPAKEVTTEHLEWVRDNLIRGAELLDNGAFYRAIHTFDSAIWAHSLGSAIIMSWAALETLFRPGRQNITKTLSKCIASFLYPSGSARDKAYQEIERLYRARGSAVHDAQIPESEQLFASFQFARRSFEKCLETGELPNAENLILRWKEKR